MRCFKVTVEYDGTDFFGFQYQVGQRSVQEEIERAIEKLTGQAVRVHGAGRTDTGVHALGQVIGFRADTRIPVEKVPAAMNSVLPSDISAVEAAEVDENFHARFSARSRTYIYVVLNRPQPSAVMRRYCHHYPYTLDVPAMQSAARELIGTHDFTAWANDVREARNTTRTVLKCSVRRWKEWVLFHMEADAFLRGMVRTVVGTLLEVGSGKRTPEEMAQITQSRQRVNAGPSVPARGLCLLRVKY
ncbi:MAG TPA: tRNA pseudouridine(38-40) synthase TruA [Chthonomonadales bacterium]|nr:tRNA pseudouridine(38-40) synthase TruA [Chthonomonadales bacterium]